MLAIADNASDWGYAFPGIAYLVDKTRMSERQVRRLIDEAVESGELYVDEASKRHGYLILCGLTDEERRERFEKLQRERLIFQSQIKAVKKSGISKHQMSTKKRTFAAKVRTQTEGINRQYNHHGIVSSHSDGSDSWPEVES